jgi:multidrug resistance efflux pump
MADKQKTIDKKIKTLLRRYTNYVDVKLQRDFNRMLDRGALIPESRYDDLKDRNKSKKLDARAKKIERQLDAAYAAKSKQEEAERKAKEDAEAKAKRKAKATKISAKRKLRMLSLRGRGGGAMTDLSQRTGATAKGTLFKKKLN